MKQKLAKFALYVYENHIQEDFLEYKQPLKFFIYPAWFVRSIFIWILCPFLIPEYLFKQSKVYAAFKTTGRAPTPQEIKKLQKLNKNNTQNFINRKKR